MALIKFASGTKAKASEVNKNLNRVLKNSIINSLNIQGIGLSATNFTTEYKFKFDTFSDETKIASNNGFLYDATNKYYSTPNTGGYYIIISATSLTTSNFSINNCLCYPLASGKWVLFCTTGTANVRRAQIMKTLFYGTNGTDATVTGITSLTSLQTSSSSDEGKRAYFAKGTKNTSSGGTYEYSATFANTTTNTDINHWHYLQVTTLTSGDTRWEIPTSTIIASNAVAGTTVDALGTDTSANNKSNSANCRLRFVYGSGTLNADLRVLVLTKGNMTWTPTGLTSSSLADYPALGVPDFVALTDSLLVSTITSTSTTITSSDSNVILFADSSISGSTTTTLEASFDGGSNYTSLTDSVLSEITNVGTSFVVRITFTRTSLTDVEYLKSYGAYYDLVT